MSSVSILALAAALSVAGDAVATPIVRPTVLGDPAGPDYVPAGAPVAAVPSRPADPRDAAMDAVLANAADDRAPVSAAGPRGSRSVAAKVSPSQSQVMRGAAVPRTVIPGISEGMAVGQREAPLVPPTRQGALDDLRFLDEADQVAQAAREADPERDVPVTAADESASRAEAVREAVKSAREIQKDESVQAEIKAVLDEETEVVEFKLVEIGELDKVGDDGDGVLGMVRVIKAGGEDEYVIDENGQVLVKQKSAEKNQIMRWSAADVRIDPAKAGADGVMPETLSALSEGSLAMVGRLGTSSGAMAPGIGSDILAQGATMYGRLLDPSVLAGRQGGGAGDREPAKLTFEQFLGILRGLLFQTQTIAVIITAFALSFGLYRVVRKRS